MKILEKIACLLALAALLCPVHAPAEQEALRYYYLNPCEHCSPEADFAERFRRLTGRALEGVEVEYFNVYQEKGRAAYEAETAGWSEDERKLPLLIVGDAHYAGETSIDAGLTASFGAAAEDGVSRVYFLTAGACDSCERARETVDGHPAIVPLEIDGRTVASEVRVEEISVSVEPERAMELLGLYAVPDALRITPMILMGKDTVLSGERAIAEEFLTRLREGAALGSPTPGGDAAQDRPPAAASVAGAVAAGIAGGFNPCALSMLMAFLGALLSMNRRVLRLGALYLAGKLALYLAIGLELARLWVRFAPPWFPLAARIAATAVGLWLIALNVMDAASARRQAYGEIRNQLPSPLRGGLTRLIRRGAAGRRQASVAVLLGIVVGAGEFLCAGQLYLGVLIASAQSGAAQPIVAYCLAFLLPSLAVLIAVGLGKRVAESADWVLAHMPAIKLATAGIMAAILVVLWIKR